MEPVLPRLAEQLREAVAATRGRKGASCPEALQCVGVLAEALHAAWKPYAAALIEPMILNGLSPTLVLALQACLPVPCCTPQPCLSLLQENNCLRQLW